MPDLGFSYADLGILTAVRSILAGATQGLYGFATPFIPRAWLLGIGNIVLGVGTLLTDFTQNFGGFLRARAVASAGASAQHPVGYSLLAADFLHRGVPERRHGDGLFPPPETSRSRDEPATAGFCATRT